LPEETSLVLVCQASAVELLLIIFDVLHVCALINVCMVMQA